MWQIITCSLIDQLIIAVRKFQRFSDLSFISAFEPIRPFAVNSSVHLVKKFEWQLIFCLNTLIFISQTHMQKFSTYFPAVFL